MKLESEPENVSEKKFFRKRKSSKSDLKKDSTKINKKISQDTLVKTLTESNITKDEYNDDNLEEVEQEIVFKTLPLLYNREKKKPLVKQMVFMPVRNMHITSPYAYRIHPIFKTRKLHTGIDLRANYDNVYAIMNGVVIEAGYSSGNGNYIAIQHRDFITYYLHLSTVLVKKNQQINAGTVIAISGNTGTSTAPHLHFAVKENGKFIDPVQFLNDLIILNNTISTYGSNRQISQR